MFMEALLQKLFHEIASVKKWENLKENYYEDIEETCISQN